MTEDQPSPEQSAPDPKPSAADPLHTDSGAPTNAAHENVGDGTLTGSVPAGLTPEQLLDLAEGDQPAEPGTG